MIRVSSAKVFRKEESISKQHLSKNFSTFFFFGDLDVNFVLTVFDPSSYQIKLELFSTTWESFLVNSGSTCHYGDEYETEYSESIETHTATSIHNGHQKSTDTAYNKSVDIDFNRVRDGDYSIGSWADEHHHESFEIETVTYTPGTDKLQDSFTDEELLNMQKRDDTYQFKAEAAWERTCSSQSIDTRHPQSIDKFPQQSIDIKNTTSIDNHSIPKTTTAAHYTFLEKILQISFRQPMEQTICSCINAATANRRLQRSSMTQLVA
ncbi:hypothetical protein DY000_02016225 [Brassica cretica]|uniref:Uncharacterized protein n=1 Tax=Brassica cretica TaxID=69181 RepID=A0ABQ7CPF8_BRACR|nr:hypothetical protein DY000_02016225 [Brassica cretica]